MRSFPDGTVRSLAEEVGGGRSQANAEVIEGGGLTGVVVVSSGEEADKRGAIVAEVADEDFDRVMIILFRQIPFPRRPQSC
jgi:hypothetical protein